jgi:hypothetical protein
VAAAVALLAGGIGGYVGLGGGQNASAAVALAVNDSLGTRTADWTMQMTGHVAGQTFTMNANGASDFTTNQTNMSMVISDAGQHIVESGVYDGQTVFINLGDLIGRFEPGKTWVSVDMGHLSTGKGALPGGGGGDPTAVLRVLGAQGNTVTPLGSSVLNGASVQGYAVHMTQAALDNAIAEEHLPSWMKGAISLLQSPDVTYEVYINGANRLDRLSSTIQATVAGQKLVETVQQDFSNYGAPVHIIDPPPDQVVSFDQFLQAAGQASST